VNDGQGRRSKEEGTQQKTAYGFFLVLAAIVVVAIMYSVTLLLIDDTNRAPELVFGAMAASFTVIGTLVGTYFGIKAGLDGQDRVKDAVGKAIVESEHRLRTDAQRNGDRTDGKERADGRPVGTSEPRGHKPSDPEERQDWEKVGV
jgi:hypothetical protein